MSSRDTSANEFSTASYTKLLGTNSSHNLITSLHSKMDELTSIVREINSRVGAIENSIRDHKSARDTDSFFGGTPRTGFVSAASNASMLEHAPSPSGTGGTASTNYKGASVTTYTSICAVVIIQLVNLVGPIIYSNDLSYIPCDFQDLHVIVQVVLKTSGMENHATVFKSANDKESLRQLKTALCAQDDRKTTPAATTTTFAQIQQTGMMKFLKSALAVMHVIGRLNGTLEVYTMNIIDCLNEIGWPLFTENAEFSSMLQNRPVDRTFEQVHALFKDLKANQKKAVIESLLGTNKTLKPTDIMRAIKSATS